MPEDRYGEKWSINETILAFYYFCRLPYDKISMHHSEIVRIASLLGRTPSSVAMKMLNLAHFDPELQKKNIVGLPNASKLDEEIVSLFYANWEGGIYKAKLIEKELKEAQQQEAALPLGTTHPQIIKARLNQRFFRNAVLTSYRYRCCISGLDIPELLIASHIKPWRVANPKTERTNPSNGLCLSALYDRAFDKGLITITPNYIIKISSKLSSYRGNQEIEQIIKREGQKITLPEKFIPGKEFLEYHNDVIFVP